MNIKFLSITGILLTISALSLFWKPVTGERITEEDRVANFEQIEHPALRSQDLCNEHIINGGFEEDGAWSFEGGSNYNEYYVSSGQRSGVITTRGKEPDAPSYARQSISIPQSYKSLTIQFDTLLSEPSPDNDIYVAIYDEDFQSQLDSTTLSYDTPHEWYSWTLTPSIALHGQTIYLAFVIEHSNEYYHTSANFDNVSMIICESPVPTETPNHTPTSTNTSTNTSTSTSSPTPTPTNTSTSTSSPTPTPTNTSTSMSSPTATSTKIPEPTLVSTGTPTHTPSSTPTETATSTPTSTATPSRTYTPTHTPSSIPPGILNLRLSALEISQGIQTTESGVPLIADRPTIARVFIEVENSTIAVSGVTAKLYGTRNGEELEGSPLLPFNLGQSIDAPSTFDQRNFNDSLNFRLPLEWTQAGSIEFRVEVNSDPTIEEERYDDNANKYDVKFIKASPLEIVLIPIAYQKNGTGSEYRPDMNAENNWGLGLLDRTYPVSNIKLKRHPEYLYQGDMDTQEGWNKLIRELLDLRTREQPNSSASAGSMPKYYGILPPEARLEGARLNDGLAYQSGTVAIGLVDSESAAAHHLGHNLGLLHVKGCGNPAEIDAEYPHVRGRIGHIGIDVIKNKLLSDINYYDLMSYCSPKWISAYHYQKLFDQIVGETTTTILIPSWLISGRIYPDKTAKLETIEPIMSVAVEDTGTGEYKLELYDDQGIKQFRYSFDPIRIAEEEHGKEPADFSLVVRQISDLRHIQILNQNEDILTEMTAATAQLTLNVNGPEASSSDDIDLTWEIGTALRSAKAEQATVNIRYSSDEGNNWQTIATGLSVDEFSLERSQLSGSENGLIEVVAVDRNQMATQRIEVGPIADKSPEVGIVPAEKREYYVGEPIFLDSRAIDFEDDTIPNHRLRWFVDKSEAPFGMGQTLLFTEHLAPGDHIIRLQAEDTAGNTAVSSVTVTIYLNGLQIYLPFVSR